MATTTTTDILEEDAADLQFPKDNELNIETFEDPILESVTIEQCATCKTKLSKEPFIRCDECCDTIMCVTCFSIGLETLEHENNHRYHVDTSLCSVFQTSDWSPSEEVRLLDAMLECGYGNWQDLAKRIPTRTEQEIQQHYDKYYIYNCDYLEELPRFNTYNLKEQKKPQEGLNRWNTGASAARQYAGYNVARGDFEVEYHNSAEHLIMNMKELDETDEDHELEKALQTSIISAYNECLKERRRRKKVIKEHGLLTMKKTHIMMKYETLGTRGFLRKLQPFMQLLTSQECDFMMEGINYELVLKNYFCNLKRFRENGLVNLETYEVFEDLALRRKKGMLDLKKNVINFVSYKTSGPIPVAAPRKRPNPINVMLLPGVEKLDPEERELCSVIRVLPEKFYNYKNILITESNRNNGIRLATARQILKIDVNKTRKIFDFLLERKLIIKHF